MSSSSKTTYTRANHPLLMIPGPTEFADDVLDAIATPGTSHVDGTFINAFGEVLDALPAIFEVTTDHESALPLVLAGSGTLGWDVVAANFCEPGDEALVINTGYFGDSFGDCLRAYGVKVSNLRPSDGVVGSTPSLDELRLILLNHAHPFKLVTVTHVDTSTGVRSPVKEYAQLIRELSPNSIIAVDGVCSIAGEELKMTTWDIDVAFTGSQKALGVPPGLLVAMFRKRALDILQHRTKPVAAYYVALQNWIPIVQAYRARRPSYFATPPVQLIFALNAAIHSRILAHDHGVSYRIAQNKKAANCFRAALSALHLHLVATDKSCAANTLSAIRFPKLVDGPKLLASMKEKNIVIAGGLHKDIKAEYFRVGHMGISIDTPTHLRTVIDALERSLLDQNFQITRGAGLEAFDSHWASLEAHL